MLDYSALPITYACHCLNCQTMSGSGFVLQALVPLSRFSIEGGVMEWSHTNSQGKVTTQRFCMVCKTRLYSTNDGRPGIALVRAGTLDESGEIIPAVHMWVRRKQSWIGLPAQAETYDEAIPPDRVTAIFAPNFV
jgi:hypothetical protein